MLFPKTPNVSLVAFYQEKPLPLKLLLTQLQQCLSSIPLFKHKFLPHSLEQIHGTLIGCEGLSTELGIINKWFYEERKVIRYTKINELIIYLNNSRQLLQSDSLRSKTIDYLLPLEVQFGGYQLNEDYQFLSRNLHPYQRSFQLQQLDNDMLIPILIGWSIKNNRITSAIDTIRHEMQELNLLHKYHNDSESIDNDLYMRLGTIRGKFNPETLSDIEIEIRNFLQKISPQKVLLDKKNLALVQYQDLSLPVATTKIIPVTEITAQKLIELYPNS